MILSPAGRAGVCLPPLAHSCTQGEFGMIVMKGYTDCRGYRTRISFDPDGGGFVMRKVEHDMPFCTPRKEHLTPDKCSPQEEPMTNRNGADRR